MCLLSVHPPAQLATDSHLQSSFSALVRTGPPSLEHWSRVVTEQVKPCRSTFRVRAVPDQRRSSLHSPESSRHWRLLSHDNSFPASTIQKRHRMLSSLFCGAATSVTLSPKFPLIKTTSPFATILFPTTRSTGSVTCLSNSTTSPGPRSRISPSGISQHPKRSAASNSTSSNTSTPGLRLDI